MRLAPLAALLALSLPLGLLAASCGAPALTWNSRPVPPKGNAWHCSRGACEPSRDACDEFARTFAKHRGVTHERAQVAPCQSLAAPQCFTYHSKSTGLDQTKMISTRATGPVAWRYSCWDGLANCEKYRQEEEANTGHREAVSPCQEWR